MNESVYRVPCSYLFLFDSNERLYYQLTPSLSLSLSLSGCVTSIPFTMRLNRGRTREDKNKMQSFDDVYVLSKKIKLLLFYHGRNNLIAKIFVRSLSYIDRWKMKSSGGVINNSADFLSRLQNAK